MDGIRRGTPRVRAGHRRLPDGGLVYIARIERTRLIATDGDQLVEDIERTVRAIRPGRPVPGTLSAFADTHARDGCLATEEVRPRCRGDCMMRLQHNLRKLERMDEHTVLDKYVIEMGYPEAIVRDRLAAMDGEEVRMEDEIIVWQGPGCPEISRPRRLSRAVRNRLPGTPVRPQ